MSKTPSDAELAAFADAFDWDGWIAPALAKRAFARAVLAKWGAPQPVAREPLSNEQIESIFIDHGWHWSGRADAYIPAVRDIEAAHGITQKGGKDAE